MNIILHVGQAKTGTTSIQKSLRSFYQPCLEAGVLYPVKGNFREQHHLIELGFTQRKRMRFVNTGSMPSPLIKPAFKKSDFKLFWERLGETIQTHRPDTVILSSEMLFKDFSDIETKPGALRGLLASLAPDTRVTVVAYIRSPRSWFIANAQQLFRQNFQIPRHRLYAAVKHSISYYLKEFPGQVRLHNYDQLAKQPGGTLAHFIQQYAPQLAHLRLEQTGLTQENQSISIEILSQLYASYARLDSWSLGPLRPYLAWSARDSSQSTTNGVRSPLQINPSSQVADSHWLRGYLWLRENHGVAFEDDPWLIAMNANDKELTTSLPATPNASDVFALDQPTIDLTRNHLMGRLIKSTPKLVGHLLSLEKRAMAIRFKNEAN